MAEDQDSSNIREGTETPGTTLRKLDERLDKAYGLIETLQERTNTLTRLLDLMGRRLDRLELKE